MDTSEQQPSQDSVPLKLNIEQQSQLGFLPVQKCDYARESYALFKDYRFPPGFRILPVDSNTPAHILSLEFTEKSALHEYKYIVAGRIGENRDEKRVGGTRISCEVKLFSPEKELIFQTDFSVGFKPKASSDTKTDPEITLYIDTVFRFRIYSLFSHLPETIMVVLNQKPVNLFLEHHLLGDNPYTDPDLILSVVDNLPYVLQKEAIPTLVELLGKSTPNLYEKHIVETIERIGKIDLEMLKPSLENQVPGICVKIIGILGRMGPGAFELVNSCFDNEQMEARQAAILALKEIGTPASISRIAEVALKDANPDVRHTAVMALLEAGAPDYTEFLHLLKAGDAELIKIILNDLKKIRPLPEDVQVTFNKILKARTGPEVVDVIRAIGPKDQSDIPYLLEQLKNEDANLRIQSANTLAAIGMLQIVGNLEAVRDSEKNAYVWQAINAAIQSIQTRFGN